MAEAQSENVPRPVSVIAVDGAAVDNARSDTDRVQVPFRFDVSLNWPKTPKSAAQRSLLRSF